MESSFSLGHISSFPLADAETWRAGANAFWTGGGTFWGYGRERLAINVLNYSKVTGNSFTELTKLLHKGGDCSLTNPLIQAPHGSLVQELLSIALHEGHFFIL